MFSSNQPLHPRIARQEPNETREYFFDWSDYLVGDETIDTSVWTVQKNVIGSETQLTIDNDSITGNRTFVYLKSNDEYFLEAYYNIYNTITTSTGRTNTEYFAVVIVGRESEDITPPTPQIHYLKNDGSVSMIDTYIPVNDYDIATKKWVLDNVGSGGNVDLSNYFTKPESNARFALITSLGSYYTKVESDTRYASMVSLGSYYTKVESDSRYAYTSSLDSYYTKLEVDTKVSMINSEFSNYYNKSQSDGRYVSLPLMTSYYTKNECDNKFALIGSGGGNVDLTNYYTKPQSDARYIPLNPSEITFRSVDGLKTMTVKYEDIYFGEFGLGVDALRIEKGRIDALPLDNKVEFRVPGSSTILGFYNTTEKKFYFQGNLQNKNFNICDSLTANGNDVFYNGRKLLFNRVWSTLDVNTTITELHENIVLHLTQTAPITITFTEPTTIQSGVIITLFNRGTANARIVMSGSAVLVNPQTLVLDPMPVNTVYRFIRLGSGYWYVTR